MSWQEIVAFASPLLDVAVIGLLTAVLVRLRRDPSEAWAGYEARLRELQENLRLLVAQAEGEARELDERLAAHAERLRLAGEAPAAASPAAAAAYRAAPAPASAARAAAASHARRPSGPSLPDHVRQLVAEGLPIAEIARRLAMPVAEARILAGLSVGGPAHAALHATLGAATGGQSGAAARSAAGGASS